MPARRIFVFDAYGTLFDVHSAASREREAVGAGWERLSDLWRTKQLEYTWVLAAAGRYATFWKLTEEALDVAILAIGGVAPGVRGRLLDAYRALDAYPEVGAMLARLRDAGARTAILSNGDPDLLAAALRSAGLEDRFDAVLSVAEAGVFKPAMKVYALATRQFGVEAAEITFVSSNRWDVAGGKAFGFRTVWVNRRGAPDEYPELAPDTVLGDLSPLAAEEG